MTWKTVQHQGPRSVDCRHLPRANNLTFKGRVTESNFTGRLDQLIRPGERHAAEEQINTFNTGPATTSQRFSRQATEIAGRLSQVRNAPGSQLAGHQFAFREPSPRADYLSEDPRDLRHQDEAVAWWECAHYIPRHCTVSRTLETMLMFVLERGRRVFIFSAQLVEHSLLSVACKILVKTPFFFSIFPKAPAAARSRCRTLPCALPCARSRWCIREASRIRVGDRGPVRVRPRGGNPRASHVTYPG